MMPKKHNLHSSLSEPKTQMDNINSILVVVVEVSIVSVTMVKL